MSAVTVILDRAQQGDSQAAEELLPLGYEDLRKHVTHRVANEAHGHTLQPAALVIKARPSVRILPHLSGAVAEAMRRILIESARRWHRVAGDGRIRNSLPGNG